jgi:dTDP-4-dehydrorhamnose reductase
VRILLTGRNGQVGWELERALVSIGEVVAFDRQTLDLANPEQVTACVRKTRPDVIVNAAAYTAVDTAESEPDTAMAINGTAPGILADEAKRLGSLLVHYSTDYVFDGSKDRPYTEQDPPNPINVYGKTKLAGERAIQDSGCRHVILRTAWVYADRGKNFLLSILRLAKEKPELRVVDDQHGAPTWARDIAGASVKILEQPIQPDGVYHLTAAGDTTWCGFARAIIKARGLETSVVPIASSEYPVAAVRPMNSLLSNVKLNDTFGFCLPDWSTGLHQSLALPTRETSCDRQ